MGLETALVVAAYASVAASIAGGAISYVSSQNAAKQTELNAEAQARALKQEQDRKNAEAAENQRRLAIQGKRERAQQAAEIQSTGFLATTGTPLSLMADTLEFQSQRAADLQNDANLTDWQLRNNRQTILAEGGSRARQMRSQAGASLVSSLGNVASGLTSAYSFTPRTAP